VPVASFVRLSGFLVQDQKIAKRMAVRESTVRVARTALSQDCSVLDQRIARQMDVRDLLAIVVFTALL